MHWIYLSPHFDDVALSCGGLLWEQTKAGHQVEIWTICAGNPERGFISTFASELHTRWQFGDEAAERRRAEDLDACSRLGAGYRHFPIPDCIYRYAKETGQALYATEESLFGELKPAESPLVEEISCLLEKSLPAAPRVVCPLSVGGHVDHRLTRAAAEMLGLPMCYYADFPYADQINDWQSRYLGSVWQPLNHHLSGEAIDAWIRAVASYESQISTFWSDNRAMADAIRSYAHRYNGVQLWHTLEAI